MDFIGIVRRVLSRTVVTVVLLMLSCGSEHQRSPATGENISCPQAEDPMLWKKRGRGLAGGDCGLSTGARAEEEKRKRGSKKWSQGTPVCTKRGPLGTDGHRYVPSTHVPFLLTCH